MALVADDREKRAIALCEALLTSEGLGHWTVRVNRRMTRTLGRCDHPHRIIQIAAWIFERCPPEEIEDVVRHEVAHAVAGHRAGHGPVWKAHARRLGAEPTSCARSAEWTSPSEERPRRILLECTRCGHQYRRKIRVRLDRFRCGACRGRLRQSTIL